jgi:hypothetical protein
LVCKVLLAIHVVPQIQPCRAFIRIGVSVSFVDLVGGGMVGWGVSRLKFNPESGIVSVRRWHEHQHQPNSTPRRRWAQRNGDGDGWMAVTTAVTTTAPTIRHTHTP